MSTLSVIIPCRNAEDTLDLTLRSVLATQGLELEVVVLDDNSTDGTATLVSEWAKKDSRVCLVADFSSSCIAETRQIGVERSQGDWVGFIDADDWLDQHYLPKLVSAAQKYDVSFAKGSHVQATGTERLVIPVPVEDFDTPLQPLDHVAPVGARSLADYPNVWSGVYRRQFLLDNDIDFGQGLRTAEDRLFTWKLILRAPSFVAIQTPGYFYRREVHGSLTHIGDERQLDFISMFHQVLDLPEASNAPETVDLKLFRQACGLLYFHYHRRTRLSLHERVHLFERSHRLLQRFAPPVVEAGLGGMRRGRARLIRDMLEQTVSPGHLLAK